MSYDPLTDDIGIAFEAAQSRARAARMPDGTFPLEHLLSGFDLHPKVMAALLADQVENHSGRLSEGADPDRALMSIAVVMLLIGLYVGEVREARKLKAEDEAA